MTVFGELLFHLEAASAYAEQGELHSIQNDIDALIRRIVRKEDDPGDDSGPPPPRSSGGLLSECLN